MRRKEKEITDKKILTEILDKSQVCRIAMIDNNEPYIVPLNFGHKNNILYIHSASQGRKIELLKKSEKVCFEMELPSTIMKADEACKWATKYRSIIGYGRVKIVEDDSEKRAGLDVIMEKYGRKGPNQYKDSHVERMVLLEITIDSITGKQSGEWG